MLRNGKLVRSKCATIHSGLPSFDRDSHEALVVKVDEAMLMDFFGLSFWLHRYQQPNIFSLCSKVINACHLYVSPSLMALND